MRSTLPCIFIISLFISCNNNSSKTETDTSSFPPTIPIIGYAVKNSFPHDTTSFTEGLSIHNGLLFESTGSPDELPNTKSLFGIVDLKTGKIDKKGELEKKYFGEGTVFLNDKLYQLTYKNKVGFIYDAKTFKKIKEFSFSNNEGWGLTTDGKALIMSDGTQNLTFIDPVSLQSIKTLSVTENGLLLDRLNELEYIKGYIYANVWSTNNIVKIDPNTGAVLGKIDLGSLAADAKQKHPNSLEMNGIAYDSISRKIYVTGKMWPSIYQIDFAH
ncbi:MAG: glutaminyl-peptide cyclotransferase [Cytophagaceae bacterium]|nr:glutaminyl-peptide cyclotransferase [Cytophagaceae bacterium]